jgi:hypothetical protein
MRQEVSVCSPSLISGCSSVFLLSQAQLHYCEESQEGNRPRLTAEDVVRPRVRQSRHQVSEVSCVATVRLSGRCGA